MNWRLCGFLTTLLAFRPALALETVDYLRDVKPILSRYCYACHGDEKTRGGLRLDTAAAALEGGRRGSAIVAGSSATSLLVRALRGEGGLKRMPYKRSPLTDREVAIIRAWIDQGATAPADETPGFSPGRSHWAFAPVTRPKMPEVRNRHWVRSPIDHFILARLEAEGIEPSPRADRVTLIRRLSFDLLGLPPTPEEVDAFVADESRDACARLVDRLLQSPRFGERWGRHWLDVARYADSHGFTIDGPRSIWKYRDWVIDALNRDLPFDQFTIEQIAGDLLPQATREQIVATGFHRNTLINQEGGTDREQFRIEAVADRVNTTGTVFLGLTVGCARCHDHKYDPITQEEYYRLFAFLNSADEPEIPVPDPEQERRLESILAEVATARKELEAYDARVQVRQEAWERSLPADRSVEWKPLRPVAYCSEGGATMRLLDDASVLVGGRIPDRDTYTLVFETDLDRLSAIRLETLTHESLPRKGPGLAGNGNFVLSEFRVSWLGGEAGEERTTRPSPVRIRQVIADHSQKDHPAAHAIDGEEKTGWAINVARGSLNLDRRAVFLPGEDVVPGGRHLQVELVHRHASPRYQIGRFRIAATGAPASLVTLPAAVLEALRTPPSERGPEKKKTLRLHALETDPARRPLQSKLAAVKKRESELRKSIPKTMVIRERGTPRPTHVHIRGDFLRKGKPVTPAVPAVLPPLPTEGGAADRLKLARWLVSRENPLTARVTVNRIWQRLLGRGLVETENDFGTQGSPPTHPELLDWLAKEFVDRGWSIKGLLRMIVSSSTYQESSQARPELDSVDPRNRLLARQNRLRLDAEIIRDAALAASGLLSEKIGGPGVFPPQPEGIFRFTQSQRKWNESHGEDRFRRGMYTFFWRSSPYPFLTTFDAPNANVCSTRRVRSNTPLQALTMANDPAVQEIARGLAERIVRQGGDSAEARIRYAFRLALARSPAARETAILREHVEQVADAVGDMDDRPEAWLALARVLINLDEFITRD